MDSAKESRITMRDQHPNLFRWNVCWLAIGSVFTIWIMLFLRSFYRKIIKPNPTFTFILYCLTVIAYAIQLIMWGFYSFDYVPYCVADAPSLVTHPVGIGVTTYSTMIGVYDPQEVDGPTEMKKRRKNCFFILVCSTKICKRP